MIQLEDFNKFVGLNKARELEEYYFKDLFASLRQNK